MADNINQTTTLASDYIVQKRDELEEKLRQIDRKYSTEYQDTELNLPDSLELEKMTYTLPSEEELTEVAKQSLMADYTDKKFDIESTAQEESQKVEQEKADINSQAEQDIAKLNAEYSDNVKKSYLQLLEQGLVTSSVRKVEEQRLATELQKAIEEVEQTQTQKLEQLSKELTAISQRLAEQLANLDKVFQEEVEDKVNQLLDEAYKQQETVLKYNNSVQEKEQEYIVTKEKTEFNAFMDEADRAIEASKLLATIGVTGVTMQKEKEKTEMCKEFFGTMNKADALAVIQICTTLPGHLGQYYDYLVDYVENM